MLVSTIREYKHLKESAAQGLQSVSDVMNQALQERKRKRSADETEAETEFEDDDDQDAALSHLDDGAIRRGQCAFGGWTHKLCDELLTFLEPKLFDKKALKILPLPCKYECMEMSLDIACFGSAQDRVAIMDKKELFVGMRKVYHKLGRRFAHIQIDLDGAKILWSACAPWTMESGTPDDADGNVVLMLKAWVLCAKADKKVVITKEMLTGDEGPFTLMMPFSLRQAHVYSESTKFGYNMWACVPGLNRLLKARASDEENVTSLLQAVVKPHAEAMGEKTKAKAKAKVELTICLGVNAGPTRAK